MTVPEWLLLEPDRVADPGEALWRLLWPVDWYDAQTRIQTVRFLGAPQPYRFAALPVGAIYHFVAHVTEKGGLTPELEVLVRDLAAAACTHVDAWFTVTDNVIQIAGVAGIPPPVEH